MIPFLLAVLTLVVLSVSFEGGCNRFRSRAHSAALVLVLMIAAVPVPNAAANTIQDIWSPTTIDPLEVNLYEVYNTTFGTSYTSSAAIPQVSSDEAFNLLGGSMTVTGLAHFAGLGQEFGFYQSTGGVIDYTPIFDVQNPNSGYLPLLSFSAMVAPTSDFGFYSLSGGNYWHSQTALNLNGADHMVMLATPDPYSFLLGFEDLPFGLSDFDFNDLVIGVTLQPGSVVPEPATYALLGIGIAGMAVLGRIRRQKEKANR